MRFFILGKVSDMKNKENVNDLAPLRTKIDKIDRRILELINQRLEVGRAVGNIKKKTGAQILDRNREQSVIDKLLKINQGPATEQLLRYFFDVIITATREIQKSKTISYLGPRASNTHIAALTHFKHSGSFVEASNLYEIFSSVDKKLSHFGVVPIENSMEGAVNRTLDLFVDFEPHICAEHFEPISHDLLSITGDAEDVKIICSHPKALGQCRTWIKKKFPHAKIIEKSSVSKAAQMAADDRSVAAIASRQAAHLYELQIVESQIEDYPGNITRFLVIGRQRPAPTGNDKTSIMFATSHKPGALFKALAPVDKAGINMLKLESRPIKGQKWSYYFFLDIQGHMKDRAVAETLEAMRLVSLSLKVLGSYPAGNREGI